MAEALGLAASGIAVGQAVVTLGRAILAVKRLCDEVSELPESIAHFLAELEVLSPVVADAGVMLSERGSIPDGAWNDGAARRAVEACQLAASSLEKLASKIQANIAAASGTKRRLASLKALLKKDELRLLEKRLESAIRVLMLAQNSHLTALVRSQPDLIVQRLESITYAVPATAAAIALKSPDSGQPSNEADEPDSVATEDATSSACPNLVTADWPPPARFGQLAFRQSPGGFRCRVASPPLGWAMRRGWELLVDRSYLGWKIQLQQYIHDLDDSLLIDLASKDAAADLHYLIQSGQAVLRPDSELFTHIINATMWYHSDYQHLSLSTLRMLSGLECLKMPGKRLPLRTREKLAMSMALNSAAADAVASGEVGSSWDLYFDLQDPTEYQFVRLTNPYILQHAKNEAGITQLRGRLYREYDNFPVELLVDLLNPVIFTSDFAYGLRLFAAGNGGLARHMVHEAVERRIPIFPRLMNCLAYESVLSGCTEPSWSDFIRNAVTLEGLTIYGAHGTIGAGKNELQSPLLGLVKGVTFGLWSANSGTACEVMETITRFIRLFVQLLIDSGVDVASYGEWESQLLHNDLEDWEHAWCMFHFVSPKYPGSPLWRLHYELDGSSHIPPIKLKSMRYGPSADDWDLTWETCEEEFAGYFWNHIEDQLHREEARRYSVPGSWVEEKDSQVRDIHEEDSQDCYFEMVGSWGGPDGRLN